jgi:hypothetical protein
MSSEYQIDNEGIGGGPFLSMSVDETTAVSFDRDDVDENTAACCISANNTVSKGSAGTKLFGKVVWVSNELIPGTTRPVSCAVQARGVGRFQVIEPYPLVNQMVELDGTGKLRRASADAEIAIGGHMMRGQIIAIDTTSATCDVWLG